MPELIEIIGSVVDGTIRTLDASEKRHLLAQIDAISQLAGGLTVDGLKELFDKGWLPDYLAAGQVVIAVQLAMTTGRERSSGGTGSVEIGPLRISGHLSETFRQATTTNLSVTITMDRQSRSRAIEGAVESLRALPIPDAPKGGPA